MAYISKIKIGNTSYEIKDTVARNAAAAGFAIKVVETLPTIANTEAFYNEWKKYLVLIPNNNAEAGTYIEYVLINKGTGSTYDLSWEQIGSTKTSLNGIKSSGSVEVPVGVERFTYTQTDAVINRADYTPTGTINKTKDADIIINDGSYVKVERVYDPETANNQFDYVPDGSVTVTPNTVDIKVIKTEGTDYTITPGSVTQTECTKGTVVGSIEASSSTDYVSRNKAYNAYYNSNNEELELTPVDISVNTTQAVTDCGTITYTAPTLSGSLPTYETKTVVTGIKTSEFNGQGVKWTLQDSDPIPTGVTGSVTAQAEYSFTGTTEPGLKVTAVKYDKTTGIEFTTESKTVNVVSSGN